MRAPTDRHESKEQRAARLKRELISYRVETLTAAALILQSVDRSKMSFQAAENLDKIISILNTLAEGIRKAP